VFQVLLIVVGYALTRSNYKVLERLDPWFMEMVSPRIAWYTELMLVTGPWLLILPLVWGCIATITADVEGGIAEVSERQVLVGYALSGLVALFCISSVIQIVGVIWGPIQTN
jgi:hypothetical protein